MLEDECLLQTSFSQWSSSKESEEDTGKTSQE